MANVNENFPDYQYLQQEEMNNTAEQEQSQLEEWMYQQEILHTEPSED